MSNLEVFIFFVASLPIWQLKPCFLEENPNTFFVKSPICCFNSQFFAAPPPAFENFMEFLIEIAISSSSPRPADPEAISSRSKPRPRRWLPRLPRAARRSPWASRLRRLRPLAMRCTRRPWRSGPVGGLGALSFGDFKGFVENEEWGGMCHLKHGAKKWKTEISGLNFRWQGRFTTETRGFPVVWGARKGDDVWWRVMKVITKGNLTSQKLGFDLAWFNQQKCGEWIKGRAFHSRHLPTLSHQKKWDVFMPPKHMIGTCNDWGWRVVGAFNLQNYDDRLRRSRVQTGSMCWKVKYIIHWTGLLLDLCLCLPTRFEILMNGGNGKQKWWGTSYRWHRFRIVGSYWQSPNHL